MANCLFVQLVSLIVGVTALTVDASSVPIAAYPPMHWHSWNTFCTENGVNETNMREMADALIETGMVAVGYDTVNVVCNGWTGRDPVTHKLQQNKTFWPNGIESLATYLHSKDMKLGCYTSPGTFNCCHKPGSPHSEPGSLGYEDLDMETFAQWGCDHVMVDLCEGYINPMVTKQIYAKIGEAIAKSSNPNMMYGIWPGAGGKNWKWGADVNGTYWRVTLDIYNAWYYDDRERGSVLHNFDVAYSIPNIDTYTSPGKYTFLDQMVVGVKPISESGMRDEAKLKKPVGGPGLSMVEQQSHMTMWVMAASPLLTCNDVRNMTAEIKEILTNAEVLAVHKDPLAKMAVRVDVGGGFNERYTGKPCSSNSSVYQRELVDGSFAVMVLNRDTKNVTVTIHAEDLGDGFQYAFAIRDLWRHENITMQTSTITSNGLEYSQSSLSLDVQGHGVRMLRIWPILPTPPASCPHGYGPHANGYWNNTNPCPGNAGPCTEDHVNGTLALCGSKCDGTIGCMAFEVFSNPPNQDSCYIFLNQLQVPFTASESAQTCVAQMK